MGRLKADIVVGLCLGDEGKGKVSHYLLKQKHLLSRKPRYTHCIRYNGGPNAGHTIYHQGQKYITHQIPAGVFHGIPSIIGPECVVDPYKLIKELQFLFDHGLAPFHNLKIDYRAHVITGDHITEELPESSIGTTKSGIGPAYRDKYSRTGLRAANISDLQPYLTDIYYDLHHSKDDVYVLCEGAQGFGLDITWGDYPFVTSSHCTAAGALLNGIPYTSVKHVYGVAKCYETYVGAKQFQNPNDPILADIAREGNEFGATTGRSRQVNYLNLDLLEQAVNVNGVDTIIFNKLDVLRSVETLHRKDSSSPWKVRFSGSDLLGELPEIEDLRNEKDFKYILRHLFRGKKVIFSDSPESI